jgi:hypothetical protein
VTAKKKNSTYYFSRDVEEGEMLMIMIMSENHTMPVTGPCDSDSGYLNLCSELSTYGPSVVLTIHRSGEEGGTGYGQSTCYSRLVQLDSSLAYCNRVSDNYTVIF